MSIKHTTMVDIGSTRTIPKAIHLTQYDNTLPVIEVTITKDATLMDLSGMSAEIRWGKPDNHACTAVGTVGDNTVTFPVTQQMCAVAGISKAIIQLSDGTGIAGTGAFQVMVEPNPINDDTIVSDSVIGDLERAIEAGVTATAQAAIATNKASEAAQSAGYASSYKDAAQTYANNASTSEANASKSAESAGTSAQTATDQAKEATTQADNASKSATSASNSATTATQKASEATTQASNASTSASEAQASATEASKLVAQVPNIYKFTESTALSFTTDTTSITQEYTFDEHFPYSDTMYYSMNIELSDDSDDVFYEVTSMSASGMTVVYTNKAGTALSTTATVKIFGFLGE